MIAVIAGALVVLMGALYAVLFAFGRLWNKTILLVLAYSSFGLLTASVLVLANTLNLNGTWQLVSVTLLLGYLLAPQAIWQLSVGTHASTDESEPAPLSTNEGVTRHE